MVLLDVWTTENTFLALTKLVFPLIRVEDSLTYPRSLLSPVGFPLPMISMTTLAPEWKTSSLE